MNIRVFSRQDIESGVLELMLRCNPGMSIAVISITDPDAPVADIVGRSDAMKVRRVQFHDVDLDIEERFGQYVAMTPEQAKNLVEFWRENMEVDLLAVHCEAGISRSAAVAAACAVLSGQSDEEFFEKPYIPNRHVYNLMLEVAGLTNKDHA